EAAVARQRPGARQDQVSQTGEAGEGPRPGAEGDAEARDLGQPPGQEGGPGVGAELEAVGDPGRDGHDVLEGAAQLRAHDVRPRVEPEGRGGEEGLQLAGEPGVWRGENGRGRT